MNNYPIKGSARRIQFFAPSMRLTEEAFEIREILKNIQKFSDDDLLHELRTHVSRIPATQALLDALVTPRGVWLAKSTLHSFNKELESLHDEDDAVSFYDPIVYECEVMLDRLIEWRKGPDGSLNFVTPKGDLNPFDIGIDINREDLDEFLRIVEIQNNGNVSIDRIGLKSSAHPDPYCI